MDLNYCWAMLLIALHTAPRSLPTAEKVDFLNMLNMGEEL
jgi:hypothetical protein